MYSRTISEQERQHYLQIAHDLRYPDEIIERIQRARTVSEVERTMITARKNEMRRERQRANLCHQSA